MLTSYSLYSRLRSISKLSSVICHGQFHRHRSQAGITKADRVSVPLCLSALWLSICSTPK